jgi:glycosyltransferase involved in cell wall biosynthesis
MAARIVEHLQQDGWDAAFLPINPKPPGLLARLEAIKYVRTALVSTLYLASLRRELERFDVIHLFSASYRSFLISQMPAILTSSRIGRPVILNYRSGEAEDHLRRSGRLVRSLLGRCHSIVVPSQFLVDVFERFGFEATAIPNFVDPESATFRLRSTIRPKIIVPRALEPLYNVSCALRTFRIVKDECPEAELTILGEGSQEAELRSLARALDLRDVYFAGPIDHRDIGGVFDQHDILLNTSSIDNMPVSLLEGFAAGLPIVTTDAGGIPYMIRDRENGHLVDVDDHIEAASRILELCRYPAEVSRLSRIGLREAKRYSWERVADSWSTLYSRVFEEYYGPVTDIGRAGA